jgi:GH35 family endo-1,4-beta-xylanase
MPMPRLFRLVLPATVAVLVLSGTARALVIKAENARIRTAGAAIPGGPGWNLHSNGEVGDYVYADKAGRYTLVVRVRGTPCQGEWPVMSAVVDNMTGPRVIVDSKEFAEYALTVEIPAGTHVVTVAFDNDAKVGDEDRNLYLAQLELKSPEGVKEPLMATREDWMALGEQREEAALERAAKGVEQYRKSGATIRVVDAAGKAVTDAVVTAALERHDFLFGCNIYMFDRFKLPEQNAVYKKRFRDLFNCATTGFYWKSYEPERGKPRYEATDKVVAWAAENGVRLKGHPLLWGDAAGIPPWSPGQPPKDVQKARVEEIVRRYAGKIEFWEVVNEPSHVRSVAIDEPYRWARAADPKATLIVNDYYVMANGYPPFFKLLEDAKAAGVPFDGIGIQAHEPRAERFPLEQVQRVLDHYATLGKPLHITEFTPASGGEPITGSHRQGVWNETAQAEYAERFYRVAFGHPATMAITWWDLCDQGAWLKGGGLLRNDLSPKTAYDMLWRLIQREWKTKAEGRTDGTGAMAFRGIHGQYRVRVEFGGRKVEAEFHLGTAGPNDWTVKLGG